MGAVEARFRRQIALEAIEKIRQGAIPLSLETQSLDFKEETGTFDPGKKARVPIPPKHAPAAQALAEECACLANSDAGGILVVGVNEKTAGDDAFVGTHLDVEWLRERIYTLSQPHLSVDLIETIRVAGRRIYLINIPPALEEIRVGGKLRTREDDRCVELDGNKAREFLERRRQFDWTLDPSGFHLSDASSEALASARRHYEAEQSSAPRSNIELARRLGVINDADDTDDPELTRAGSLLLCQFEPQTDQIDVLITRAEGAPSNHRLTLRAPLLPAFDETWELVRPLFDDPPVVIGAQRVRPQRVPERAVRESIVNALMHRDYRLSGPVTITVIGEPPAMLTVVSPGGFPRGVPEDRLISVPSRPRNPALANALRVLGLAEREGVGIDEMYTKMLRDGQPAPSIRVEGADVVVRLRGGRPNPEVRALFDTLYSQDDKLEFDVAAHLAVNRLLVQPTLRVAELASLLGSADEEVLISLEHLAELGVVERLVNRSLAFRLSSETRDRFRTSIQYEQRRSIEEHGELVRAYLDGTPTIGREEAAVLLGVKVVQASRILSQLARETEWLSPVGSGKGRGNRYRLTPP